ncbi:MAG: hypothetical protein LC122_14415 [Chitinophagales bacterium]|nr:hypothetical protein [Chitinophagales bacterium]
MIIDDLIDLSCFVCKHKPRTIEIYPDLIVISCTPGNHIFQINIKDSKHFFFRVEYYTENAWINPLFVHGEIVENELLITKFSNEYGPDYDELNRVIKTANDFEKFCEKLILI